MSSLAPLLREARELIDARKAAAQSAGSKLEGYFSPDAVAEYRSWRAGGPVPTSPQGLELTVIDLELDGTV